MIGVIEQEEPDGVKIELGLTLGRGVDADLTGPFVIDQHIVLLGAIEMGACRPEVRFDTVNSRIGIEAFGMAREL